jgi:type 2 lantibiotic biosynthesis protein LanM
MPEILTEPTTRSLAWDSLSLRERLHHPSTEAPPEFSSEQGPPAVLHEWSQEADNRTKADIAHQLRKADYLLSDLATIEHRNRLPEGAKLPKWLSDLDRLLQSITDTPPEQLCSSNKYIDEAPFVEFLSSIVSFARTELQIDSLNRVSVAAVDSLNDWLLHDLVELTGEALYTEFRTFLALNHPNTYAVEDEDKTHVDGQTDAYEAFIHKLHSANRLEKLVTTYPVMGRWLMTVVSQWVDAIRELDARLDRDWEVLHDRFKITQQSPTISDLDFVSADSHGNGRLVIEVSFNDATQILYKPKRVTSERLFDTFLEDVERVTGINFKYKTVIGRDSYGWVGKVNAEACNTAAEINNYYVRAGGLLGAAYLLYLNDGHYENILASGQYPMLIDVETLLAPKLSVFTPDERHPIVEEQVNGGVYWTGMLPQHRERTDLDEPPALNGFVQPKVPYSDDEMSNKWVDLNTDRMRLEHRDTTTETLKSPSNIPELGGETQPLTEYTQQLQDGFTAVSLAALRGDLPLRDEFKGLTTRAVLRNTSEYDTILSALRDPKTLRDGCHITYVLDELVTDYMRSHPKAPEWDLYHAERMALHRLDIPRFTVDSQTGTIFFDDQQFDSGVKIPGYTRAEQRFETLTREQIAEQRDYIQLATRPHKYTTTPDNRLPKPNNNKLSPPEHAQQPGQEPSQTPTYTAIAEDIYDKIIQQSVPDNDCDFTWLKRRRTPEDRLELAPMQEELYGGRLGIAVFSALLAEIAETPHAGLTAHDLADQAVDVYTDNTELPTDNLGLAGGVASYIYGFTLLGRYLDGKYYDIATALADRITEDTIAQANEVELLSGVGGLTLALLALYNDTERKRHQDTAIACGEYLCEHHPLSDTNHSEGLLTGFAHGTAGVQYTLEQVQKYKPQETPRLREVIEQLDTYRDEEFNQTACNWPDRRSYGPEFTDSWCHGRAGIVQAQLATPTDRQIIGVTSIEECADSIDTTPDGHTDQLCCGNAGRVVVLTEAALQLDDTTYQAKAIKLMDAMLERQKQQGYFELEAHSPRLHNVSLFQGLAGIGYALLRLQHPTEIPNILFWE